jgi:hypothetical protein
MAGRGRGRPPRSDDERGYREWRLAEERAAEAYGEGPAPVELVVSATPAIADASTVWAWRKVVPSVRVWRAWLAYRFGDEPGMAELIASGALDDVRRSPMATTAYDGRSRFHATIVPQLAAILTALRGRRPADTELARMTGASVRTVRRHRTDPPE